MTRPLVSVIIPIYNAEDFVVESIQSVLDQDYDNVEIIISDDCSTDRTKEVILEFLRDKDTANIKIFFNPQNLGVTNNCNQCLRACTGEYIAFHAGDDVMLPKKISTQVSYLEQNKRCKISYHNIDVFNSKTNKTLYYYNSFWRQRGRSGTVRDLIKHGCFCGGCSIMTRRADIPKEGYDGELTVGSDWFLWISILLNGGEIHYIAQVLSRYRRHDQNVTNSSSSSALKSYYQAFLVTSKLITNHPMYTKEALKAFGIHLRALRKFYNGQFYKMFLLQSLRFNFSIKTLLVLVINILTFNKIKL